MQSRRECLRRCYEVEWPRHLIMVTLTYPGGAEPELVAGSGVAMKKHMEAWKERLRRHVGAPRGLWKMEFQRRGAPHLHLWLERPAGVSVLALKLLMAQCWVGVVGSSSKAHRRHGVKVEEWIGNPGRYVAAYTVRDSRKEYQHRVPAGWQHPGRFWGMWGLRAERAVSDLELGRYVGLRRTLRRYQRSRGRTMNVRGLTGAWVALESDADRFVNRALSDKVSVPVSERVGAAVPALKLLHGGLAGTETDGSPPG
jgi:hypothetical protein